LYKFLSNLKLKKQVLKHGGSKLKWRKEQKKFIQSMKNFFLVVLALFFGSAVNMGIIMFSSTVVPLPEGVDPTSMDSIKNSIHLFKPIHFLSPFLAHALGTLVGSSASLLMIGGGAYIIATFFAVGGIANVFMIPSPTWFAVLNISMAYFPMAFLATILFTKKIKEH
jgi:hypothetical protein